MKKFNLDKESLKEVMYGGVTELLRNPKYFYRSKISSDYSQLTEEGTAAITSFLQIIAVNILEAEEATLEKKARDLVIKGLKGEQT